MAAFAQSRRRSGHGESSGRRFHPSRRAAPRRIGGWFPAGDSACPVAAFGDHQRPGNQAGDQVHDDSRSTGSPLQISSMASSVQPPENTDIRASSRCSAGVEQVIGPVDRGPQRRVPLDGPPPSARRAPGIGDRDDVRSSAGSTRSPGLRPVRWRAARRRGAGRSPRRHGVVRRQARKSALTWRARSTNRLIASVCTSRSMSSSGFPRPAVVSAMSCSPSIAMPSRLVARTTTPGQHASIRLHQPWPPAPASARSCRAPAAAVLGQASRQGSPRATARRDGRTRNTAATASPTPVDVTNRRKLDQPSSVPIARQQVGGNL